MSWHSLTKSQWDAYKKEYERLGFVVFFEDYPNSCWGVWPKFTTSCINLADAPKHPGGKWHSPEDLPPHIFPHYAAWKLGA